LPERGDVHVWYHEITQVPPAEIEAFAGSLSIRQRAIVKRFREPILRERYIVSHAMTMSVLGFYTGPSATPIVLDARCYGKPYLAAPESAAHLQFNMAHSDGMTVVAVAAGNQVGIDIERLRTNLAIDEIAPLCFAKRELTALADVPERNRAPAFLACWTRKEALLKAQGTGFTPAATAIDVGLGDYEPLPADSPRCSAAGWTLSTLDVGANYAGAVAIEGISIRTRVHPWEPHGAPTLTQFA
jgi:4'-phosphopantetheinyl transferase